MARVEGMEVLSARLASFEIAHPATKRRTSSAKNAKTLSWPHANPSTTKLAHAGFFFKPSSSSPDNTVCFLCGKYLDGWEEEDDPVEEHMKHSSHCAWAILTNLERLGGEERVAQDPIGEEMTAVRRSTFASVWPHEGKRGWVCKIEKMVEAGWYFCPTQEGDDFVSCAYCNLCLDGWEPKDDPFNEHKNGSPDCRFFNFTNNPTTKRGRKGRLSKASRLSTQSNAALLSEAPSIPDLDISIDQGALSDSSMADSIKTAAKGSKKSSKAKNSATSTKAKGTRGRKGTLVDGDSGIRDLQEDSLIQDVHQMAGRGKKRTSDQMSVDRSREDRESTAKPIPPPKRRMTRNSVAQREQDTISVLDGSSDHEVNTDAEASRPAKKGRKKKATTGRKRGSTASRKASTASKVSLRAQVPADSDIDAALEADLERPLTDEETASPSQGNQNNLDNQAATKIVSASTASVRRGGRTKYSQIDGSGLRPDDFFERRMQDPAIADAERMPTRRTRGSALSIATTASRVGTDLDSSMATIRTMEDDSGHETDASMASKSTLRKGGRKKAGTRKTRLKKTARTNTKEMTSDMPDAFQVAEVCSEFTTGSPKTLHTKEGVSGLTSSSGKSNVNKVIEIADSSVLFPGANEGQHHVVKVTESAAVPSMVALSSQAKQNTPSPSPQPSDAENCPPSSRPSNTRPPVFSPSQQRTMRIPLAPGTPVNSPSKRTQGSLQSSLPWKAVDIESVFQAVDESKENAVSDVALTSAEKKMTVEEWINWNAQAGEEKLRQECERQIGIFEREGGRAMRTIEGIECIE